MRIRNAVVAAATVFIALASLSAPARAQLVYDSITNADGSFRPNGPRTFMGDWISFQTGNSNPVTLRSLETRLVHGANVTATYSSLIMRVQFWNDNIATSGNNFFINPASSVLTFDLIPLLAGGGSSVTLTSNQIVPILVNLPDVVFTDPFLNGIAINFQGNTGSGLVSTDNLTTLVRFGVNGPAIGTSNFPPTAGVPRGGYFRNESGRTDFNFNGETEAFTVPGQNNAGLALRLSTLNLTTAVPEPGTVTLVGVGLLALGGVAVRRRRRGA